MQAQYLGYFGNKTALTFSRSSSINLGTYENENNEKPLFDKAFYSFGISRLLNPHYVAEFQYAERKLLLIANEGLYHKDVLYYSSPNTSRNKIYSFSLNYYNSSAAPIGLYIGAKLSLSSTQSDDPRGYKFEADTGNLITHYQTYEPTWLGFGHLNFGYGIPIHDRFIFDIGINMGMAIPLTNNESSTQNEMYSSEMITRTYFSNIFSASFKLKVFLF